MARVQIISPMITLSKVKSFYLRATDPAGGGWGHGGGGHRLSQNCKLGVTHASKNTCCCSQQAKLLWRFNFWHTNSFF